DDDSAAVESGEELVIAVDVLGREVEAEVIESQVRAVDLIVEVSLKIVLAAHAREADVHPRDVEYALRDRPGQPDVSQLEQDPDSDRLVVVVVGEIVVLVAEVDV